MFHQLFRHRGTGGYEDCSCSEEHLPLCSLVLNDQTSMTQKQYTPIMSNRNWEVFPGRNKFYCDGRIIMTRNNGVFYFTVVLIVITSGLFFAFDCPYLFSNVSPAVPVVAAWLFIFVMSSLLRTAFSDPGIVPRASLEEAAYIEKTLETPNQDTQTYRPPPRVKEITINGQAVKLKFCFTCKIFRPPRASHCSMCDNCVERFDHHCPWVGNCVGKRNYKFFFMFLVSLSIYCSYLFAFVVTHLVMLSQGEESFISAMKKSPASILEAIVCFFSIWSIVGLTGFHSYLVASNQTTNEDIKGSFSSRSGQGNVNPFSEGSVWKNCAAVLCGPFHPSLINRRGVIIPEPPASDKYGAVRPVDTAPMSPVAPNSKNGVTHDAKKAEEHSNLLPKDQEQDSLQADSERGLVKLSSV